MKGATLAFTVAASPGFNSGSTINASNVHHAKRGVTQRLRHEGVLSGLQVHFQQPAGITPLRCASNRACAWRSPHRYPQRPFRPRNGPWIWLAVDGKQSRFRARLAPGRARLARALRTAGDKQW